ncbi:MAG: hypothetical protein AAF515_02080 [Pseudomonadota bacterium]
MALIATAQDFRNLDTLIGDGMIPYRNLPTGTRKSEADLQALANTYFPNDPHGYHYALVIYDWTSADFVRFNLFTQMAYTSIAGDPLDVASMQQLVWAAYHTAEYSAENADFMNMFGLPAADSLDDVINLLTPDFVHALAPLVLSECRIFADAVLKLPDIPVASYPNLFRGAMPMSVRPGLSITDRFGAQMLEFSGNAGPLDVPLSISLPQARQELFYDGATITPKTCWSFSDSEAGAKVWQQGIIVAVEPPSATDYWPGGADITPFSLNPGTVEFNFPMRTRYQIKGTHWFPINDVPVLVLNAVMLGRDD